MPIETTKTTTATSPHSDAELTDILQEEARKRLADVPYRAFDVVRITDPAVIDRVMLLRPDGVVLSYDPADRCVTGLWHNVDGHEVSFRVTTGQIEAVR